MRKKHIVIACFFATIMVLIPFTSVTGAVNNKLIRKTEVDDPPFPILCKMFTMFTLEWFILFMRKSTVERALMLFLFYTISSIFCGFDPFPWEDPFLKTDLSLTELTRINNSIQCPCMQ